MKWDLQDKIFYSIIVIVISTAGIFIIIDIINDHNEQECLKQVADNVCIMAGFDYSDYLIFEYTNSFLCKHDTHEIQNWGTYKFKQEDLRECGK